MAEMLQGGNHCQQATSELSVSKMQGRSGQENASVGTSSIAVFNRENASSALSVHRNLVPLRVRRVKGSAIVANPLVKRR